jgi:hypothetical protein
MPSVWRLCHTLTEVVVLTFMEFSDVKERVDCDPKDVAEAPFLLVITGFPGVVSVFAGTVPTLTARLYLGYPRIGRVIHFRTESPFWWTPCGNAQAPPLLTWGLGGSELRFPMGSGLPVLDEGYG